MTFFQFFVPGRPRGKVRRTGNQTWKPDVKAYTVYKKHVAESFLTSLTQKQQQSTLLTHWLLGKKPLHIETGYRVKLDIEINFHSEVHPDPEGIFGAIADALLDQDKHCYGSFVFTHDKGTPEGVAITLAIYESGN